MNKSTLNRKDKARVTAVGIVVAIRNKVHNLIPLDNECAFTESSAFTDILMDVSKLTDKSLDFWFAQACEWLREFPVKGIPIQRREILVRLAGTQRYDIVAYAEYGGEASFEYENNDSGEWVKFEDIATLLQEVQDRTPGLKITKVGT